MKKFIAAILSLCIVGGALPAVYSGAPENSANAYSETDYEGVDGTSEDRITAEGEIAGDVDGNAGLTANDALIIQRYSLKLIDTL